ncbi:MAG: DNA polymerase III subunit delta [Nitrospinales bacterium]
MSALITIENLKLDNRSPVYFLYGEESFFHTEFIRRLTDLMVTPDNQEFNLEKFDAKSNPPADWIGSAKTFSFFGGDKLVIVRGLDEVTLSDKEQAALLEYIDNPEPNSCLVLTALKADRKRKLFKKLTAIKGAIQCTAPKDAELYSWLRKRADAQGYKLDMAGANILVDRIGPRPGILASELEKLITFTGDSKKIGANEASQSVGETKLENVFAMTDALNAKNTEKALKLLHNQLHHGEEPIKIMGTIIWQLRMIWTVKHFQDKKIPSQQIAREAGGHPFVIEKAMKYTRNFSRSHLRNCFRNLFLADRELKTSAKNPEGIMETLVMKLCLDSN